MKALRYAKRLVEIDSTSRLSNRVVSKYLEMKLTKHGFIVERLQYRDQADVRKVCLVAKKGTGAGGLAYSCHTDVVPAEKWFSSSFGPFDPKVINGRLYGRGSCDMKGSLACFMAAAQQFDADELTKPIYMVVTADEEVGFHGARHVVSESKFYRELVDHGAKMIIGEPTNLEVVYAHKGSLCLRATGSGRAAHSSTGCGDNANLRMIPFLQEMLSIYQETERETVWHNPEFDPPSLTWNIGIKDDAAAINVTASSSVCTVYARPMPQVDCAPLIERAQAVALTNGLTLEILRSCDPLYTPPDSDYIRQTLQCVGQSQPKTVAYATDGGVFTEVADKLIFGPGDIAQAHTHDEWISLEQLALGTTLYAKLIRHWCTNHE
ncbi:MAG TPA: M20/M25/M40 family metallo-hydrolase [Pirellulaceae bacterium]|nr:M20/M25/M40 family metallo-hydrolase [Pirellulaceae bacterium]